MPESLTDLERGVLDYLVEYLRRNTYQPSIREIGTQFGIRSTKTVSELLHSLAEKGYIERDGARSRGVRVLGLAMMAETVSVPCYDPLLDTAAAGPVTALELDRRLTGPSGTFIVTMPDDALRGDGIRRGDLLLVEPVEDDVVEAGDVVLARHGGASVVRRFARHGRDAVLETCDATDPAGPIEIAGRVIGVVRRLRAPHASPDPVEARRAH